MSRGGVNVQNRKAGYDYIFLGTWIAGIQLIGPEVKSIREGKISLLNSYCYFRENELYLRSMSITCAIPNYDPCRDRKILMTRQELQKLEKKLEKGMTLVVNRIFTNDRGFIKVEIALAKGKKNYDKKKSIMEREILRDINR